MASYRLNRINEETAKALSSIIRDVKDYRLANTVISIVSVSVSPDLSSAKVYYSYMGDKDEKEIQKGLVSASGYIRTRLAQTLDMRQTPRLTFVYDKSMAQGAKIFELMHKVEKELKESDDANPDVSENDGGVSQE